MKSISKKNQIKKVSQKKKKNSCPILVNTYIFNCIIPLLLEIRNYDFENFKVGDVIKSEDLEAKTPFSNLKLIVKNYNNLKRVLTINLESSNEKIKKNIISFDSPNLPQIQTISYPLKYNKNNNNWEFSIDLSYLENINPFFYFNILERPSLTEDYEQYQNTLINNFKKTGVIFKRNITNNYQKLINQLNHEINNLIIRKDKIYHPGSNEQILDIVHPSLNPLINKNYKTKIDQDNNQTDFWNRPYENSKYQMLPSEFTINKVGYSKINSYINNLDLKEENIYKLLEKLFDYTLPEFEKVWGYINTINLYNNSKIDLYEYQDEYCNLTNIKSISLKNRDLQVICKITKTTLKEVNLNGVWHVEGMSHEHIVASAVHVLNQDTNIDANLYFRRPFTTHEASLIYKNSPQDLPHYIKKLLEDKNINKKDTRSGLIPLGKVSTCTGSLTVFPNSHIHKLEVSNSKIDDNSRTVIVFWLINPNHRIKSSKDIPLSKLDNKLNSKETLKNQLEFMKERKFYKNKFNLRDLNLCEH